MVTSFYDFEILSLLKNEIMKLIKTDNHHTILPELPLTPESSEMDAKFEVSDLKLHTLLTLLFEILVFIYAFKKN